MTQETKKELFYNIAKNREVPEMQHLDLPSAKGMKIISAEWVPVSILYRHATIHVNPDDGSVSYSNVARSKGIDQTIVGNHTKSITIGNWKPYHNQPPTVTLKADGTYSLVTGEHRLQAHRIAGMEYIFVCVVEFFDFEGKPAAYWEKVWQSNENSTENSNVAKNLRTEDDMLTTIFAMIKDGSIKFNTKLKTIDEESSKNLKDALVDLQLKKNTTKFNDLYSKVIGETIGYKGVPRTFSTDQANAKVSKDTKYTKHLVKKMTRKSGIDTDYDQRFSTSIFKALDGGAKKVFGYMYFGGMTTDQIIKCRKKKMSVLLRYVDWCRKVVALADAGRLEEVELKFLGQLDGEKEFVTLNEKSV